nr:MAG TPA: hypothetical protein [Caudoviricetes sp.]
MRARAYTAIGMRVSSRIEKCKKKNPRTPDYISYILHFVRKPTISDTL